MSTLSRGVGERALRKWERRGTATSIASVLLIGVIAAGMASPGPSIVRSSRLTSANRSLALTTTSRSDPTHSLYTRAESGTTGIPLPGVLSCASNTFCMSVNENTNGATTSEWNGTVWSASMSAHSLDNLSVDLLPNGLSCGSQHFCVIGATTPAAADASTVGVAMWNGNAWTFHGLYQESNQTYFGNFTISSISCPSVSFCMAVGAQVWTWNGQRWTNVASPDLGGQDGEVTVSCANAQFCVAAPGFGNRVATWEGESFAWSTTFPSVTGLGDSAGSDIQSVSCAKPRAPCMVLGEQSADPSSFNVDALHEVAASWDGRQWAASVDLGLSGLGHVGQIGSYWPPISCSSGTRCIVPYLADTGHAALWNKSAWSQVPVGELDPVSCEQSAGCMTPGDAAIGATPVVQVTQVVFVHGIRTGCATVGTRSGPNSDNGYAALYDALAAQGMQIYTFCYDHDSSFGAPVQCAPVPGPNPAPGAKGPTCKPLAPVLDDNRCFSDTSRGVAAATRVTTGFDGNSVPLYANPGPDDRDDGDGPLAYDATKLEDCLKALIRFDRRASSTTTTEMPGTPGFTIAVIGNSQGGAIVRGWIRLTQARHSVVLSYVTTVLFLEAATEGSWADGVLEGVDGSLGGNPASWVLDQVGRWAFAKFDIDPNRPALQDLAPRSAWYQAIAASPAGPAPPPPHLHYFTFSVDITLSLQQQLFFWNMGPQESIHGLGDGIMRLGDPSPSALPVGGGSEFLPFPSAADQHQFVIKRNVSVDFQSALGPALAGVVSLNQAATSIFSDPYSHFQFGSNTGSNVVNTDSSSAGQCASVEGLTIGVAVASLLTNPASACNAP